MVYILFAYYQCFTFDFSVHLAFAAKQYFTLSSTAEQRDLKKLLLHRRNYFCTAKSFNFLACLTITVFITKSPHHTQSQPQLPNPISQPRKLQIQIQEKDMISGEPPHWWNTLASDWPSQIAFWLVELCHPRSQPTDLQIKIWQKYVITVESPYWSTNTGSWLV